MPGIPGIPETNGLHLKLVDPATSPLWSQLVGSSDSSVFHTPEWLRIVRDTYDLPLHGFVALRNNKPVAGLPWADLSDFRSKRAISMAFSDYAGPLAETVNQGGELIDAVIKHIRPTHPGGYSIKALASDFPERLRALGASSLSSWMGIDLDGTEEDVFSRATPAARKGVRKASRAGVTTRLADSKDDLRDWFFLHLRLRKYRHRLLAQPFSFFERIWDAFIKNDRGFLVLTEYNGKIAGGMFCLQHRDTVYTKFSASDEETHRIKSNNLLYAATISEAVRRNAVTLDMGRNPHSALGLIYFKKSFGAIEKDLLSLTFGQSETSVEADSHTGELLAKLTSLFVQDDISEALTESAGNFLYRNFA